MNDLITRTRPTEEGLRKEWTPDIHALWNLEARRPAFHRGPSRRSLLIAGAAAAVIVVAVPAGLPGWVVAPATAAPLRAVAAGAAMQPQQQWADGQFLHVRTTSVQDDVREGGSRIVRNDWYAPDGWVWSHRAGTRMDGQRFAEEYIFPPGCGWMRPGYAATMPTDAHALDLFLRARAIGSTSQDEAVFVAIGDMLKQEAATPQVRAAAIGALALNTKITVADGSDPSGRKALIVTLVDEAARPKVKQSLYLDTATGYLLANRDSHESGSYTAVIDLRAIVDRLPDDIAQSLGTAKVVKDGNTAPKPYTRPSDPIPVPSQTYTPVPATPNR